LLVLVNLGRLIDIRRMYESYQRRSDYPFLDHNMFCKVMPFSRTTSQFLFDHFRGDSKYVSIFELISALVITSYACYISKMRCTLNETQLFMRCLTLTHQALLQKWN
jgi:hypothetical protein